MDQSCKCSYIFSNLGYQIEICVLTLLKRASYATPFEFPEYRNLGANFKFSNASGYDFAI